MRSKRIIRKWAGIVRLRLPSLRGLVVAFSGSLLVIAVLFGLSVAQVESSVNPRSASRSPQYASLVNRALVEGSLPVLVQLNVGYRPEGGLDDYSALLQRSRIATIQESIASRLPLASRRTVRRFEHVPIMALQADAQALRDLRESPEVLRVQEDIPVPPSLAESVPLIGANEAWAQGYDGAGWAVAVLDTGAAPDHPAFEGKVVAEACFSGAYDSEASLCPDGEQVQIGTGAGASCPGDVLGCEHGTHVAGIAAGGGSVPGVASAGDLIPVQVYSRFEGATCTDRGLTSPCALTWTADQISALEWVYEQRSGLSVAAVNMSLGGASVRSNACDDDPRKAIIDTLRSVGIATVIAAGNGGQSDGVSAPACISSAISVGASTDADAVATFSNVAEILDLFAPGVGINAPVPAGYENKSGTSMAAPHVAGAWAILKDKHPGASVFDILSALVESGVMIEDDRSGGYVNRPRVQVDAALLELDPAPTSTPDPSSTPTSTVTMAPSATATPSPSVTPSPTPTPTATPTPTPTATLTPTPTATPTHSPTPTPSTMGGSIWYLPEGYTGEESGTYILVQNPNRSPAELSVSYLLPGGSVIERNHTAPARSRYTIVASEDVGPDATFSTTLDSDVPVVVERSMYFGSGGHSTIGAAQPRTTWYLAEGYTGQDFETYILVQNPDSQAAALSVRYLVQGGEVIERTYRVPAGSRYTIVASDELGADTAFSTVLEADVPVVVERSMYFPAGGHNTIGVSQPETSWYLAEGYTGEGFATYILVLNPNGSAAELSVSYMLEDGKVIERSHTVPARSRYTIGAQDEGEVGPDAAFSTLVDSDLPVVVERSMYFGSGGHSTIGAAAPATTWRVAEGYTGSGFGTYILVFNANGSAAELSVSYALQDGDVIERIHSVPARSRYTIAIQDEEEVGVGAAFSTFVQSDLPVIVERAMYFGNGGHSSIAIAE